MKISPNQKIQGERAASFEYFLSKIISLEESQVIHRAKR